MANYGGNSFPASSANASASRLPIWVRIDEQMPCGAVLLPSETYPVGTVIPLGTPISVDRAGGTATLNDNTPDGLTLTDVVMGEGGCTFAIVTRGKIRAGLVQATINNTQKTYLKERILFVDETVSNS